MTRPLPGGRGTVTINDDGTGTVHDLDGRAVTTLPAHTAAILFAPVPAPPAPELTGWQRIVRWFTSLSS